MILNTEPESSISKPGGIKLPFYIFMGPDYKYYSQRLILQKLLIQRVQASSFQGQGVYLSGYREFFKLKYYDLAKESWLKAFDNCPGSTVRLYVDGESL